MSAATNVKVAHTSENQIVRGYARTRLGQTEYAISGNITNAALLLLPQAGRSISMFYELVERLSSQYYVIAVNYPGCGASDSLSSTVTIEGIASSIVDVMDELGRKRAHVYGIHTGNKIGVALAAQWPDRVYKLVFAGQTHSIVPSNTARLNSVGKTKAKWLAPADEREVALVQWSDLFTSFSQAWWNENLVRDIADANVRSRVLSEVIDGLQAAESIAHMYNANRAYDMERDLNRLTVPTLILEIATPLEDRELGRQGPKLLSIIAQATLVTLNEMDSHGITLENRAIELADILDGFFRNTHPAPQAQAVMEQSL